jgi:hypothetical protein
VLVIAAIKVTSQEESQALSSARSSFFVVDIARLAYLISSETDLTAQAIVGTAIEKTCT